MKSTMGSNNGDSDSKIVLDYGDSLIKESDMKLLSEDSHSWLNDTLIGFYFEYLNKEVFPLPKQEEENDKPPPRMKFFGPQVTQCIKLYDDVGVFIDSSDGHLNTFDWLFFAINDSTQVEQYNSGSHWSLVVYSKTENIFYHLDSSPGMNTIAAATIYKKMAPLLNSITKPIYKTIFGHSQINGYDCGFHALCNAQLIGQFILKGNDRLIDPTTNKPSVNLQTATPEDATTLRTTMVHVIEKLKSQSE